jgi:tetratricopeptide (TPR) repeat protein
VRRLYALASEKLGDDFSRLESTGMGERDKEEDIDLGMNEVEKEEDLDRLKFMLEQQRLALERDKWQADLELRRQELQLKEEEARRHRGFLGRLNPISVGLFSAALVLIGNLITTSMQNTAKLEADRITHTRQLDLERERFESDLIKDYIKTKPERVEENLRFLIRTGLVRLKASQLQMTFTDGPKPSLEGPRPATLRDAEKDACFFGTDWRRSEQACTALLVEYISDPRDEVAIRKRLGSVLNELKYYERAIDVMTGALKLHSQDAVIYQIRGQAYSRQEQYDLALADLNKALELDQQSSAAYRSRGSVYRSLEQYDLALADLNKALQLDPESAAAYNTRGLAYYDQEQYSLAMPDFTKALEVDPKYTHAYNNRGLIYHRQGQYDLALAELAKALEVDPKYALAYINRGFFYRIMGLTEQAVADFDRAIQLDPKHPAGWRNRALSRGLVGDHTGAQQDLTEALRLRPRDARTMYVSGILKELVSDSTAEKDFISARQMAKSYWGWKWIEQYLSGFRPKQIP